MAIRGRLIILACLVIIMLPAPIALADNSTYGGGTYGSCSYGSCSLTLSSSGTVNLNITPGSNPTCTVQNDEVSVLTDSSTGYSLSFTNSSTNTSMINGSHSIAASSASQTSPVVLATNTWGYRVDSLGGFGSGSTSAQNDVATPSLTFAGVPASNASAATLATSSSPADPAVNTNVWYGMCVNATVIAGTYSSSVTYTAVTN